MNRAPREQLCGGNGKHGGQLDHRVCAVLYGVAGAYRFMKDGGFSPLGEIPAHEAKNFIAAALFPDLLELIEMPVMKGIIFANYCTYLHFCLFNTIYCVLNTNFVLHIDCSLFVVHDLSTLITVALKEFLDFVNCIRLRFQSCVSIDVQSSGHFAVPKSLLNNFWIDAARQQYCRVSVSERVV